MENNERVFSIFKVYDYKGGELSTDLNLSFESLVSNVLEYGLYQHPEIEYSDDIYKMPLEELQKVIDECTFDSDLYAGGEGTVFEVFEHKDNRLVSVDLSIIRPYMLDIIKKDL